MRVRLLREKKLAQEKLQEEEEKHELVELEAEIHNINQRRSVKTRKRTVSSKAAKIGQIGHAGARASPYRKRAVDKHKKDGEQCKQSKARHKIVNKSELIDQRDRVKMWLDSPEDYNFVHETRSEPGDVGIETNLCLPCLPRRAL